jgi:hypothetical protein
MADQTRWNEDRNRGVHGYGDSDPDRRPAPTQGEGGYGSGYGGYQRSYAGTGGPTGRLGEGGSHRGRGPKGYQRSDERIREDVNDALTDDDLLDASDIQIEVQDCEVTLSGTVTSREDKRRAEDLVEDISGVRHVQNEIRVEREGRGAYGSSPGARSGWIGGK